MSNPMNDRVIDLLKSSGMTEIQLAEAIRKPASTVYRITRKEVKPSKPTLQLIATALGVSYLWLVYGKGEKFGEDITNAPNAANPYKDALVNELKSQVNYLQEMLKLALGSKGTNFLKALSGSGPGKKQGSLRTAA